MPWDPASSSALREEIGFLLDAAGRAKDPGLTDRFDEGLNRDLLAARLDVFSGMLRAFAALSGVCLPGEEKTEKEGKP